MQPPWLIGYVFPPFGDVEKQEACFNAIAEKLNKPVQIVIETDQRHRSALLQALEFDDATPDICISGVGFAGFQNVITAESLRDRVLIVPSPNVIIYSVAACEMVQKEGVRLLDGPACLQEIDNEGFRQFMNRNMIELAGKVGGVLNEDNISKKLKSEESDYNIVNKLRHFLNGDAPPINMDGAIKYFEGLDEFKCKKIPTIRSAVDRAIERTLTKLEFDRLFKISLDKRLKEFEGI
ncbi:hypothetical protein [Magnetospirillum sp. 15-1]|uniref:hypothetical protein n=1 Tax=Magnetospirillum sp. 15-1 TaxID=1979370 RepID=UPI001141F05D|nr:hypothetical protein [Magnetospirillum sp. 15-1]